MSWNAVVVAVGKKEAIRSVASLADILVVIQAGSTPESSSSCSRAAESTKPAASRSSIRLHLDPGVLMSRALAIPCEIEIPG